MIGSTTEKIRTYFSSEILRVPNQSHFREAKKGVTKWVCVTKWGVTKWRLYSKFTLEMPIKFIIKI